MVALMSEPVWQAEIMEMCTLCQNSGSDLVQTLRLHCKTLWNCSPCMACAVL